MLRSRKSQIWVSAVLFIGLGVIAITLVLAAALPLVDKIRDKNTVLQTKGMLLTIDDSVRTVANEGPGSQRQLTSLTVDKGKLFIEQDTDTIRWEMRTTAELLEPGIEIPEGNLIQLLNETFIEEEFAITLWVSYTNVNLSLASSFASPFQGKYTMIVKHTGTFDTQNKPVVSIELI